MSYSGKIVEYIEHSKFICALVVGDDGRRLRLINQNGREVKLPMGRVLHQTARPVVAGESKEDVQRLLQEVNVHRREMTVEVDLAAIWELASAESEASFTVEFLAGLCFGEDASEEQVAAFLRTVFSDRLFFKYREGMIQVHTPEVVEQLRLKAEKEQEKEALLKRGAEALALLRKGEDPGEWPERDRCLGLVRDYYLFGNDYAESALARELLKKAQLTGDHEVYYLLLQAGVWQQNENVPLLRYEIPSEFPEEVLEEAASCREPELAELLGEGYRDLTDLPLLTIDGAQTRDFDDALHVEKKGNNFLVGIHITDVSRYVRPGSPMFEEARRRCTTLYFADGQIPMLPEQLSEGVCSLIVGKVRPVISIMVELDQAGEVLDTRVMRGIVRVKRQLSYDEVNNMLETDEELGILERLGRTLRDKRIAGGALLMPLPDVLINNTSEDEIEVRLDDGNSGSRALVAEFMVMANTLAASYVADREVPGLFRGQDVPHKRLFEGLHRDMYLNFRQRRFLRPARITTRAKPHSCVGVMHYTTMTSPIRRFLDLVMQHQIMSLSRGQGAAFQEHELESMLAEITRIQTKANLVKRLRHRYWLLKYLEPLVGERVDALIIDRGRKRISVVLTDIMMESDLPLTQGGSKEPGTTTRVKVALVKPLDDLLRLEW